MKAIKITDDEVYRGPFEDWTEELTWEGVVKTSRICLHKSYSKIEAFQSGVTTCVYAPNATESILEKGISENHNLTVTRTYDAAEEYCYMIVIPAGYYVERYENEYRITISETVQIFYVGKTLGSVRVKDGSYESEIYGGVDKAIYEDSVFNAFLVEKQ